METRYSKAGRQEVAHLGNPAMKCPFNTLYCLAYTLFTACLPTVSHATGTTFGEQDHAWAQQRANAVISLMTFSVVPDITASNLDIGSSSGQSSALNMGQLGGGATLSETQPIYLEGALGYSRYDPQFVISNGSDSRTIPTKWNSLTVSG